MAQAPEAFAIVAEYAVALGAKSISALPGCWEKRIDEHWWVAINGHKDDMACSREAPPVPSLHCYIEYDGWPAGLISLQDGVIAAGESANEDTFIAAVKRALYSLEDRRLR